MNNREIGAPAGKIRQKREFEFLLGLINNNSKIQVMRREPPTPSNQNVKVPPKEVPPVNAEASELLLELMVKIAANPNQWDKVHQLLQRIDGDLLASRQLLEDLQKTKIPPTEVKTKEVKKSTVEDITKEVAMASDNGSSYDTPGKFTQTNFKKEGNTFPIYQSSTESLKPWPNFPEDTATTLEYSDNKYDPKSTPTKYPWQKNFSFHRVTGKNPIFNKSPKAYIAVSVIAPKPAGARTSAEDFLENDLKQLKPWTHQQNLKNMANIRSKWVIQTDDPKIRTDDLKLQRDDLKMQRGDLKMQRDDLKMRTGDLRIQTDDLRIQTDDLRIQTDDLKIQTDDLKRENSLP